MYVLTITNKICYVCVIESVYLERNSEREIEIEREREREMQMCKQK